MTWFTQRRSDRPDPARLRPGSSLENLERRELLTVPPGTFHYYHPAGLIPQRVVDHSTPPIGNNSLHPLSDRQLSFLDNDGKILTGKDRAGNEWTITVHGPGSVIVTDATPNDGVLDDDIDTIQLVGTSLTSTYVTGDVVGSARTETNSTVRFNHLIALDGVKSIILHGFTLAQTVAPPPGPPDANGVPTVLPNNINTGISLLGGVQFLQFHNIEAPIDLATNDVPINIVIGNPATPMAVQPVIRLDSIFNTVFDSSIAVMPNGFPQTTPTVNIEVNGQLKGLDFVSSTAQPIPAGFQFAFPTVSVTGRTAVRALGVGHLRVHGSARNLTLSRSRVPFTHGFSGVNHLRTAQFGGVTDGVGLDVNGPIHKLQFARGVGDPTGAQRVATSLGTPDAEKGYAAFGFYGGLVRSNQIGSLKVGPANLVLQTGQDPDFNQQVRRNQTKFYPRPGHALTNAAIVSAGSIGHADVKGNLLQSEIKTGFHYPSYLAGLEGTRARSRIGPIRVRGDLIDSAVSATYRPSERRYGVKVNDPALGIIHKQDVAGPGTIRGRLHGFLIQTGATTIGYNRGAGFFARHKIGFLPPPDNRPSRINGVLQR